MISIEELCGIPEYVFTAEDKQNRTKAEAEDDMKFFDLLPMEVREVINFSDVPMTAKMATQIYKFNDYNIENTLKTIRREVDAFKKRNFRSIR